MADISITAANVVAGANAVIEAGRSGEAVTAGQLVYKSNATDKYMKADTNSGTAEARRPRGIALNGASPDQPLEILKSGDVTIGAALTAGTAYYASDTPGGICPLADVGSGEYVALVGLAKSATVLTVDIQFPNVAL